MNVLNKYYLLAFIEGGLVLDIEIVVARLMAPYFGSSLYSITSVLGVTLMALLIGYYLGGNLVESKLTSNLPFLLVLIAAIFLIILPIITPSLLLACVGLGLIGGTVTSCLLLLGIPLILLGAVSPLIIQMVSEQSLKAGKASGNIYAISTLGGVISTFLLGLVAIPSIGVKMSSIIFGGVSCILVIVLAFIINKNAKLLFILPFVFGFSFMSYSLENQKLGYSDKIIYKSDGILGRLDVFENNSITRTLSNNGTNQSSIIKSNGWSAMLYTHVVATVASMLTIDKRNSVALIGLAGGSMINELKNLGFHDITAIDIDQRTQFVSNNYFGVDKNAYTFIEDDGRHFFLDTDKMFDCIIIDVSASEQQPYHLYTKEAFELYRKHLNNEGFIIINVVDLVGLGKNIITDRIGDSLLEAGLNVRLVKEFYPPEKFENTIAALTHEKIIIGCKGLPQELSTNRYEMNECCRKFAFNLLLKENFNDWTVEKWRLRDKGFRDDVPEMEKLNYERIRLIRK